MLERLTDRVLYAPGGVNIGVILAGDDAVILIDTGLNDTAVRKVLRDVAALNRTVVAIVTTHGHADHFGGNAFVVKRTSATVYAPAWDEAVLRYPLMQPVNLYAGADPPDSMRNGFLLAQASPVDVVYDAGPIDIAGVTLQIEPLAGHSPNQMGVLFDGVFFCADVVLPDRVIERYRMPYLFSVSDHLNALNHAESVPHAMSVPGHGPIVEHVSTLVGPNRAIVKRVEADVLDLCTVERTPGEVLALLLARLGADPQDAGAYYLLHPTVFAFLSHLERQGELTHEIREGRSLWKRA
jgi:glyoxylase-like metal-dependent hydrolase (beta-lactamase superfamily II)